MVYNKIMKIQIFKKPVFWLIAIGVLALLTLLLSFIFSGDTDNNSANKNSNESGENGNGNGNNGGNENGNGNNAGDGKNNSNEPGPDNTSEKVDDWQYDPADHIGYDTRWPQTTGVNTAGGNYNTRGPAQTTGINAIESVAQDSDIGFAVGGANDINNFRRNIEKDYLPSPTDISHEGIFYDYFFDTGATQACNDLFCPSYSAAVSADPFSGNNEYFLSVGLNSNLSAEDFERKKLNLVVVLDISGSMSSSFDAYYYDRLGGLNQELEENAEYVSKMEVANQSLVVLLDHLNPDDRLGVVLFDNSAYVAKDLRLVSGTDMAAIKGHILEITPQGGTNMEAGYRAGTKLLAEYRQADAEEYENRIIFLTDAMPNLGNTNKYDLAVLAEDNAEANIYTTFIGVGLDFNSELIRAITQTQGANYFAVHSREEFKRQLDDNFEYMVTPLVFDLTLRLEAQGYKIKAVYGSPEADLSSGEIMKINTLFPSQRTEGRTRGGLVLLHLEKINSQASLELTVDYYDRAGVQHQNEQAVEFRASDEAYFENLGIHKGVVLSRFVNVMKEWLRHESNQSDPVVDYADLGIPVRHDVIDLNYWERTSRPLHLSSEYRTIMVGLRAYIAEEIEVLDDESLERELELIDAILAS